jgi:subtilase family serine protease
LACRYGLTTATVGCSAKNALNVPSGGSGAIAVVLAYHYPNVLKDLTAFSSQFGLPVPNLKVVYASGLTTPPANSPANWELEGALDLQWAHAMAPNAQLILVEANTNANADLLKAVDVATQQLAAGSGGQVNMSWGSAEFSAETTAAYESHFAANPFNPSRKPIVYFASSGDGAGTSWPCVSPNVVCVGGTTVRKDPVTGQTVVPLVNQSAEVAWNSGGGGVSAYFAKPPYQNVNSASITMREVPDVALAADPLTGAWVYYTNSSTKASGWYVVGGTSWSSPTFAAIVNNKSSAFALNSATQLNNLYQRRSTYTDVQSGWCGSLYSLSATPGWDNCTGVGLPNANLIP